MRFKFSKHCLEQMQLRHIAKETVENVLKKPEQIIEYNGKKVYQSIIFLNNSEKYLIRIFVNIDKVPNTIITVYLTSKISKYYEGKI